MKFPDVYVAYQDLCKQKILKMGQPYLYKREVSLDRVLADESERLSDANLQTCFLLSPTKNNWREMADIEGIEEGLKWLVNNYNSEMLFIKEQPTFKSKSRMVLYDS